MSKKKIVLVPIRTLGDDFDITQNISKDDRKIGEALAWMIGDTFIDHMKNAPTEQWARIVSALRTHGLALVNDDGVKREVEMVDYKAKEG